VWATVPGATVSEVTSMERLMARALAPGRYRVILAGLFAVLALALTAVGVAGLAARGVATRLEELCVRMALGASPRRAIVLAIRRGLLATMGGIVIGLIVTPFTSRWLADYLYEVPTGDLLSYALTCLVTAGVCVAATVLATKRLRGVDLAAILRRG
jgi:putative ABC transport system permease protein